MANTKLKLLRILEILQQTDEEHPLTAAQIGQKLQYYGINAERKSICRDIHVLQEEAGYDIALSKDKRLGYYMVSREFEDWELKVLIDAVWSAKFLSEESAKRIVDKLKAQTSTESRRMLTAASPLRAKRQKPNLSTKINIDFALRAIKANRRISFQYLYTDPMLQPQLRRDGQIYEISPYALIWREEHYYLVGNFDPYGNLSYYRLDRMKGMTITEERRKPLQDILGDNAAYKLEQYVQSALYCYSGTEISLVLEVQADMTDDLIDYFGTDLQLVPFGNAYRATVHVLDSEGLYYWLLQYVDNLKVISPADVRDKLLQKARAIVGLYENETEKKGGSME